MYNKDGIGYQNNEASQDAANFNKNGKLTIRQQVLNLFDEHVKLTVEEVSSLLKLAEISVKPRVTELKNAGYIRNSGLRKWESGNYYHNLGKGLVMTVFDIETDGLLDVLTKNPCSIVST
jgi:hypothetical protein